MPAGKCMADDALTQGEKLRPVVAGRSVNVLDIEKIRHLVKIMVDNDLMEVALRDGEEEVTLRRGVAAPVSAPSQPHTPHAGPVAAVVTEPNSTEAVAEDLLTIKSPMVGTFYASSSPDAPPYVQVGSSIQADTVVCIVEAMKVFNEIKAEVSGIIEKLLVKNAEPVEYGQPLFLVRPA